MRREIVSVDNSDGYRQKGSINAPLTFCCRLAFCRRSASLVDWLAVVVWPPVALSDSCHRIDSCQTFDSSRYLVSLVVALPAVSRICCHVDSHSRLESAYRWDFLMLFHCSSRKRQMRNRIGGRGFFAMELRSSACSSSLAGS